MASQRTAVLLLVGGVVDATVTSGAASAFARRGVEETCTQAGTHVSSQSRFGHK